MEKKSQSFMRELKFLGSEAFIIFLSCIPLSVLWWVAFTTVTMPVTQSMLGKGGRGIELEFPAIALYCKIAVFLLIQAVM